MGKSGWVTMIARAEREAAREHRKMMVQERRRAAETMVQERRRAQAEAKQIEKEEARDEVYEYQNRVAFLTSMHKDCGPTWDWSEIVTRQAPDPPQPDHTQELAAQKTAESYVPGFFAKLFGTEKKARERLAHDIAKARKRDNEANRLAADEYSKMKKTHDWLQGLGGSILAGDLEGYKNALQHLSPFKELNDSGMSVGVEATPHDLRRTAASHMTSIGISRLVVSKILNHAERGVTAVYDRHSYDAEKREALEIWGKKVARLEKAKTKLKIVGGIASTKSSARAKSTSARKAK